MVRRCAILLAAILLCTQAQALPRLESLVTGSLPADPGTAPAAINLTPATARAVADAIGRTIAERREFALCFALSPTGPAVRQIVRGDAGSVTECPPPALIALHTHPVGAPAIFSDNDIRANNSLVTRRFTMAAAVAGVDGSLLVAIETRRSLAARAAWIARFGLRRNSDAIALAISSAARADGLARLAYIQPGPRDRPGPNDRVTSWTGTWLASAIPVLELGVAHYCEKLGLACYVRHAAGEPLRQLVFAEIARALVRRSDLRIERAIAAEAILIRRPSGPGDMARSRKIMKLRDLFDLDYRPLESLTPPNTILPPAFRYRAGGRHSLQKFRGRLGIARGGDVQSEETALGAFADDPACVRLGRHIRSRKTGKEGEADVHDLTGGSFDLVCVLKGGMAPLWLRQTLDRNGWTTTALTPVHGFPTGGLTFDTHLCLAQDSATDCQIRTFRALPDLPHWDHGRWTM